MSPRPRSALRSCHPGLPQPQTEAAEVNLSCVQRTSWRLLALWDQDNALSPAEKNGIKYFLLPWQRLLSPSPAPLAAPLRGRAWKCRAQRPGGGSDGVCETPGTCHGAQGTEQVVRGEGTVTVTSAQGPSPRPTPGNATPSRRASALGPRGVCAGQGAEASGGRRARASRPRTSPAPCRAQQHRPS